MGGGTGRAPPHPGTHPGTRLPLARGGCFPCSPRAAALSWFGAFPPEVPMLSHPNNPFPIPITPFPSLHIPGAVGRMQLPQHRDMERMSWGEGGMV